MKKLLALLITAICMLSLTVSVSADAGDDITNDVTVTVVRPAWDVVIEPLAFEIVAGNMVTKLPIVKNNMTDPVYVTKVVIAPIEGWTANLGNVEPPMNSKLLYATCPTAYGSTPAVVNNTIELIGKGAHVGSRADAMNTLDMNTDVSVYNFMRASLAKDSSFSAGGSTKVATMTINIDWA